MSITNGYITLAEFKAYGIPRSPTGSPFLSSTDTADDAVIEALIEGVSRYIDGQSGRTFYKDGSAVVRYFTAREYRYLDVPSLVSVSEIKTDTDGSRSYAITWAATDYDLAPDNAALDSKPYTRIVATPNGVNSFPVGVGKGVKVTGIWGYPAVPRDIWNACQIIAQGVYALRSGQASSGKVTITSAGIVIRPEEVPPMAQKIIESYRPKI